LPDGDFLDLDWNTAPSQGPVVLLLHGLEGSSRSHYARGLLDFFAKKKIRAALMHFRGCSGAPNRAVSGYHSGETGDLDFVVRTWREREPGAPLAVVGFSLGGNVLLKWLGEQGCRADIQAAAAVSVPFLLNGCSDRLNLGFSRVYQWSLMRRMRASVAEKRKRVKLPLTVSDLAQLKTFWDFDEHVTAKLHGFNGAAHYYEQSSCRQFLKNIERPTLIVHAKDDPFMTEATVPAPTELAPGVSLELTERGGHVGFVCGHIPFVAEPWLENRIHEHLIPHLASRISA
jgi:hypothetical protein